MKIIAKNLIKCTCKHEYQDQKYGPGMRIWTPVKTPKDRPQIKRCTVCNKEQE
jgi:hypothetical protein